MNIYIFLFLSEFSPAIMDKNIFMSIFMADILTPICMLCSFEGHYIQSSNDNSGSEDYSGSKSEQVQSDAGTLRVKLMQRKAEGVGAAVVDPPTDGRDEKYVEALEMYCLLKQRLFDVRHNWRIVVRKAFQDHGKYKSINDTVLV